MSVCWACRGTGEIPIAGMLAGYPQSRCEVCKGFGTSSKAHDDADASLDSCLCTEIDDDGTLLATGCPMHDPAIAPDAARHGAPEPTPVRRTALDVPTSFAPWATLLMEAATAKGRDSK